MEAKVEAAPPPKEEEELGRFFEKLATLVPKLKCPYDQTQLDVCVKPSNDDTNQINRHNSDKIQNSMPEFGIISSDNYGCSFSRTTAVSSSGVECQNKTVINNTKNLMFINGSNVDNYSSSGSQSNTNDFVQANILPSNKLNNRQMCSKPNQFYQFSKLTKSSHVAKPCKVRNRPAPYKLNKYENNSNNRCNSQTSDVNHHLHLHNSHHSRCTGSSRYHHNHHFTSKNDFISLNSDPPETEERLELLTDVIEYIHNLKSILETAHNRSYNSDLQLGTRKFCSEDHGDTQRIPSSAVTATEQRRSDQMDSESNSSTHGSLVPHWSKTDGLQQTGSGQSTSKLSDRAAPSTGSSGYRITDPVSVDRAMELLEYKTGAITLTA